MKANILARRVPCLPGECNEPASMFWASTIAPHAHGKRGHGTLYCICLGAFALMTVLFAGCDSDNEPVEEAKQPASQQAAQPEKPPAEKAKPEKPPVEEKKAAVGVGEKGRGYGNEPFVAVPLSTYWAMREKLAFMVQIPQAEQLFKATEGRDPKNHDEYMEKIIRANHIQLPELPEGQHYRYRTDVDPHALWVYPDEEK